MVSYPECVSGTHGAVGPAQFYLVHHPQLVNVFCKLLPDPLQVRRQHNLSTHTHTHNTHTKSAQLFRTSHICCTEHVLRVR